MLSKASNIRLDPVAVDVLSRVEPRLSADATISRSLEAEGPETRLSVILSEIADTILPRILCFETAQTSCNLIVSNARVLALAEANWKEEPRERRDAKLSRIADALHAFSVSTGQFSVTPKWYSLAPADDRVGLPCSELRDHFRNLGWFTEDDKESQATLSFKEALMQASIASADLTLEGKVTASEGDMDYLPDHQELQAMLRDVVNLLGSDATRQNEPVWLVVENAKNPNAAVVAIYATLDFRVVSVLSADRFSSLARLWADQRTEERREKSNFSLRAEMKNG